MFLFIMTTEFCGSILILFFDTNFTMILHTKITIHRYFFNVSRIFKPEKLFPIQNTTFKININSKIF